jgi:hypothetical protein
MSSRFSGTSRPNHDGDFHPSTDNRAARWGGYTDSHPPHPHRRDISAAGHRWNGPKPPEFGNNTNSRVNRNDAPSPRTNQGKEVPHIIPLSPHEMARFTSSPSRGHRANSLKQPVITGAFRLPSVVGDKPITLSIDEGGRTQLLHTITPPPQEQPLRLSAQNTPPSNFNVAAPHHLSFDSKGGEKTQQTKEGETDGAPHNPVWTTDTTTGRRGNFILQFTSLYRLMTIRESSAERRRLLTTIIDHFIYEVILWDNTGVCNPHIDCSQHGVGFAP